MPYGTYLSRGCLNLPLPNRLDKLPEKPHGERSTGRAGSASVYVADAGNSAGQGMMHLSQYASRVTLLVRYDSLIRQHVRVPRPRGRHLRAHGTVPAAALFVHIGAEPHTSWLPEEIQRDEKGYVVTGQDLSRYDRPRRGWHLERLPLSMETSMSGAFAVGEARHASVKRVASA